MKAIVHKEINMNRHGQFWLTLGSLLTFISSFIFIIFIGINDNNIITIHKEYLLVFLLFIPYFIAQFVVNYNKITEEK